MAVLARKIAISATDDGLILRPLGHASSPSRDVVIGYGAAGRVSTKPCRDSELHEKHVGDGIEVPGIIGVLNLASSAHLLVISRREQVAQIRGKAVYAVRDVGIVPLTGKVEAEKGLAGLRKVVGRQGDAGEETEGAGSEVDMTGDEATGTAGDGGEAEAEALEPPRQGVLSKGTGLAKDAVTSPIKVGRFAGKWFGRGRKNETEAEDVGRPSGPAGNELSRKITTESQTGAGAAPAADDETEATAKSVPAEGTQQEPAEKDHGQSVIESLTPRILRAARLYFASSGFFFSYEHDLSGALTQKGDTEGTTTPLWRRFDPSFFWSRHLLEPFIVAGVDELALPLLQGFVGQRAFSIEQTELGENDIVADAAQEPEEVLAAQGIPAPNAEVTDQGMKSREFLITLISRRSTKRAGLRYRRRGVDDQGSVANFVETEQMLSSPTWSVSDKTYSLLQIRGSIPLFFNQSPYSFKPQPIPFGSEATNHTAFVKHFEGLMKRYGDVQVASLVDKSATEVGIGELYGKHVQMANNGDGIHGSQIGFEWFDFHQKCKGMRFENVSILLDILRAKLDGFGWIVKQNDRNIRLQKGVLRTNCMDCLDRTNVVQSAVAGWALEKQLAELGLQIDLKKDPKTQWFNTLWADNGDYISKQYAGTAALKGDFTRTRRRNWTGALSDFSLTLTRYYNNVFGDYFMQACIDYYLGNVGPEVFEEFEADMMNQDYALDMRHIRRSGIETCIKIVLEDPKQVFKAGWTLSCPKEANTLRTLPFEECVLLLTDQAVYFCRFDWDTEKVASFERIDLRDVVAIWRGTYITSALGPTHLDEEKNVGFAMRFKTNQRALVRRNTRSLRNEEDAQKEDADEDEPGKKQQQQPDKDDTRFLAFKLLPPAASASKGRGESDADIGERQMLEQICSEVHGSMMALRTREGEKRGNLPSIEEKDVVSAADAKKATGYMESIGYSLKRMVWS